MVASQQGRERSYLFLLDFTNVVDGAVTAGPADKAVEQLVMAQLLRHVFKRWNARPEPVLPMDEAPSQIVGHHELLDREGSVLEEDVNEK